MTELDEKARARIAQLEEELEFWRNYLEMSDQARQLLGEKVEAVQRPQPADAPVEKSPAEAPKAPRKKAVNPPSDVIVDAAIHVLRSRGHPMSRRQLHKALADRGIEVQGTDPVKTLGTILWRAQDKIIQLEGYGYWPRHLSYPRASYFQPQERPTLDDLLG